MDSADRHAPIAMLLTTIDAALATFDRPAAGPLHRGGQARDLVRHYRELVAALHLRAYAPSDHTDDRLEQVVVTIHGVDLSIRGRGDAPGNEADDTGGDVFVHIDTSERDHDDSKRFPLVVEVNNCGENTYG